MISNDIDGRKLRQERYVHPAAERKPHELATNIKIRLLYCASEDHKINHSSFRVLAVILNHMYGRQIEAWPGQETLAGAAGVSLRTVQYAIRQLESERYLTVLRIRHTTNLYRLPEHFIATVTQAISARKELRPTRNGLRVVDAIPAGSEAQSIASESVSKEAESSEATDDSHFGRILEGKHARM